MIQKLFVSHPAAVGETYWRHQKVALSFAGSLFLASVACLVHAVIPGLFTRTASRTIGELYQRMTVSGRAAARRSRDAWSSPA